MQDEYDYWYFTKPNKVKDGDKHERHIKSWNRRKTWIADLQASRSTSDTPITICHRNGEVVDIEHASSAEFTAWLRWNRIPFTGSEEWTFDSKCAIINHVLRQGFKPRLIVAPRMCLECLQNVFRMCLSGLNQLSRQLFLAVIFAPDIQAKSPDYSPVRQKVLNNENWYHRNYRYCSRNTVEDILRETKYEAIPDFLQIDWYCLICL